MESAVKLNQNHFDKRDERRNRSLVRLRVVNRNTRALQVLRSTIGPGEHEVEAYEDEISKVMDLVETEPHLIVDAEKAFALEMAEEVMKRIDGFSGKPADMLKLIQSGEDESVNKEYQRLLRVSPLSVQGTFMRRNKRDVLPLISAERLPGVHAEPQREELDRETERTAGAFAKAIKDATREVIAALKGEVSTPIDIKALVAEELARQLGDKPAKK